MKPLLIYDGDCAFCTRWVNRSKKITGAAIDYAPYQEVTAQFPQIPESQFRQAIQLVDPDGSVYRAAEAAFRVLSVSPRYRWLLRAYQHVPLFKPVSEFVYKLVAQNRLFFSKSGESCTLCAPPMSIVRWIFVKSIGFIYLLAFVSMWTQISALLGTDGILPAQSFLNAVSEKIGLEKFFLLPTLFWFGANDFALHFICAAGTIGSILLIAGVYPGPVSFLLWLFYLSIANVGREFLSFQWDALLLEAGFLTIFLSPFKRFDHLAESPEPPKLAVWLLKFLLFRLMFFSGFVKLASGDATWRDLTALLYHYETQPLPTWVAWYIHQLPLWFQKVSAVYMFAIELIVPFFIFSPKKIRLWAYSLLITFQIVILATGNYCFFNLLTMALCLMLLDDQVLGTLGWRKESEKSVRQNGAPALSLRKKMTVMMLVVLLVVSVGQSLDRLFGRPYVLRPIRFLSEIVSSFQVVNGYGLFAVMTTKRPEIMIEGSEDGETWLEYEFQYKPGDVTRRPKFNIPHQPRLDWQMWFAALGRFQNNRWLIAFSKKILENSKEVLGLMKKNPFPEKAPQYLRAVLYEYHFTDFKTRKATGAWWTREQKGLYAPVMSLQEVN